MGNSQKEQVCCPRCGSEDVGYPVNQSISGLISFEVKEVFSWNRKCYRCGVIWSDLGIKFKDCENTYFIDKIKISDNQGGL